MYYNFRDALTDCRSVVHLIGMHGPNLIGLELGVDTAQSHVTLLQNCPNIKKLYGIDNWKPYTDYLREDGIHAPSQSTTAPQMEMNEFTAKHHIKWSGEQHKSEIWKGNTEDCVRTANDESFDFIFLDAWLNYDQVKRELKDWYPKLKHGGLFIGHDYKSDAVATAVSQFREQYSIKSHMSVYDSTFVWKKGGSEW